MEARIATLGVRYGTSRRQRMGDGSRRRLDRREGLGRDGLLGEAGTLDEDEDCNLGEVHVGRGVGVPEPGSRVA